MGRAEIEPIEDKAAIGFKRKQKNSRVLKVKIKVRLASLLVFQANAFHQSLPELCKPEMHKLTDIHTYIQMFT